MVALACTLAIWPFSTESLRLIYSYYQHNLNGYKKGVYIDEKMNTKNASAMYEKHIGNVMGFLVYSTDGTILKNIFDEWIQ